MKFHFLFLTASLLASSSVNAQSLRRGLVIARQEEPEAKVLAKVELPDESSVEFVEAMDGVILFKSMTRGMGEKALAAALGGADDESEFARKVSPVDFYKTLTGNDVAPKNLEDAQDRMIARMSDAAATPPGEAEVVDDEDSLFDLEDYDDEMDDAEEDDSPMAKSSSCSWWQAYHCTNLWDTECWSCRTGSATRTKYTRYMYMKAYAYRGSIYHRLRAKACSGCSYTTLETHSVPQGYFSRIGPWTSDANLYFEGKIYNASGDGWHWYVSW